MKWSAFYVCTAALFAVLGCMDVEPHTAKALWFLSGAMVMSAIFERRVTLRSALAGHGEQPRGDR